VESSKKTKTKASTPNKKTKIKKLTRERREREEEAHNAVRRVCTVHPFELVLLVLCPKKEERKGLVHGTWEVERIVTDVMASYRDLYPYLVAHL
jgi:hypothetical protein